MTTATYGNYLIRKDTKGFYIIGRDDRHIPKKRYATLQDATRVIQKQ